MKAFEMKYVMLMSHDVCVCRVMCAVMHNQRSWCHPVSERVWTAGVSLSNEDSVGCSSPPRQSDSPRASFGNLCRCVQLEMCRNTLNWLWTQAWGVFIHWCISFWIIWPVWFSSTLTLHIYIYATLSCWHLHCKCEPQAEVCLHAFFCLICRDNYIP